MRTNLDIDVLRTFVAGMELGSYARAADQLGRSPAAVSAQLKKLESQLEQPLFKKAGRKLALTDAGELLFGYAKRILQLNDEIVGRIRTSELEGWVRVGLPHDFSEHGLPAVLGQFAQAHPKVKIEARVERNTELIKHIAAGELDLALVWQDDRVPTYLEKVAELAMVWLGPEADHSQPLPPTLPIVAFDAPCMFRAAAIQSLDQIGQAWHLSFTTPSLAGLWAAVEGGLGLAVRTPIGVPKHLSILNNDARLPPLPSVSLVFIGQADTPSPALILLQQLLKDAVQNLVGATQSVKVRRRPSSTQKRKSRHP